MDGFVRSLMPYKTHLVTRKLLYEMTQKENDEPSGGAVGWRN